VQNFFLRGFGGDLTKVYSRASATVREAVSNIRTVAAFGAEEKVLNFYNRELHIARQHSGLRAQVAGVGYGITQFFMYSSYGLTLWYASTLVKKGEASFANSIKIIMVLIFAAFGVAETIAMAPDFIKGDISLCSVFNILDRKSLIDPDDPESEELTHVQGDIEFQHVAFHYPMRPTIPVFRNLNLKVDAGSSLALVGASGSGKSSVISLIQRFYDPLAGRIFIDGKDITSLNLRSLRRHVGLVQQEPALFASSIYDNILYGKEDATESEVIEAAKTANAHHFVSALPEAYRTPVGERGMKLSGGQKQRVAIARAVLRSPAILLLDEATSALDAESEKLVQEALDRIMKCRTTIIIAHRLSSIHKADMIAMMRNGEIVEYGNHFELMAMDREYAQFVHMQHFHHSSSSDSLVL
jgi:ATP-binding cassette subfamily B (MDR/TAP) protein 1